MRQVKNQLIFTVLKNDQKYLLGSVVTLFVLVFLELRLGEVSIDFPKAFTENGVDGVIFFGSRLPRMLLGILVGSGIAVSGLLIQTVFRNPLAGPTTLGINSGAGLGVALFLLLPFSLGFKTIGVYGAGMLGAVSFLLLILYIGRKQMNLNVVLIVGILLGYVAYAIIELLIFSTNDQGLRNFAFWGMGSLNVRSYPVLIGLGAGTSFLLFVVWRLRQRLNAYLLGDIEAELSGVNTKRLKLRTIWISGAWVGLITAVCGPIAFVGIVVPNLIKMVLKKVDHSALIPLTALGGAIVVLLADLLSRGAFLPVQLPLNAALAILGGPVIIYYLVKKQGR